MKNYKTKTHLTYSCQYHVVFCPKYRRNILKNGIDESLKSIFNEVALKYDRDVFRKPIAFSCGLETRANGQLLSNCQTNELQSLVGDNSNELMRLYTVITDTEISIKPIKLLKENKDLAITVYKIKDNKLI